MSDATSEIIARIDALEAQVAALKAKPARRLNVLRLTTREACEALRCSRTTLEGYAARGLLAQIRPAGKGFGKRVFYAVDEVEALAQSEDRARELVARKRLRGRNR